MDTVLATQTDQKGLVTTLSYDSAGNLSAVQDDESRKYTYSYNGRNLITGETDPLGYTFSYGYDGAGNLSSATDQNGNRTAYAFDKADRLIAALESEMMNTLNERDRRVSEVTDYIYDKTGEILGTHNDSEADQIVSGFVAGFAGSFYETFDLITHPEIILANVFEAVTHPVETALGIIKISIQKALMPSFSIWWKKTTAWSDRRPAECSARRCRT